MGEAKRRRFALVSFDSEALNRLGEADARFFQRTGRRHRIRLAGRAEMETLERTYDADTLKMEPDERMFVVVKEADTGLHLKAFLPNRADVEVDVAEDLAAFLFARLAKHGPELAFLEGIARHMGEGSA